MTKAFNKHTEKEKRRQLRKNMPKAEIILWSKLKNKSLCGYKFRRQYSVNKFVIDFYSPELKLAIEVDGDSHFTDGADICDKERQIIIESYGIEFLRFTNREVYENVDGVIEFIIENIKR
ncbi:MAG: endonuclease domain-containing protein [Thermodesulfovibrionia bacterium]|nr:endonuclease domain-containing protein [Thermodesulfovibrionia bacterium]